MAITKRSISGSVEYEAVVVKLSSSEAFCVLHEFERFNPLTYRGGNTRMVGRGRPYSETSREQQGGNGKQSSLAHLSLPSNQLSRNMCGSSNR